MRDRAKIEISPKHPPLKLLSTPLTETGSSFADGHGVLGTDSVERSRTPQNRDRGHAYYLIRVTVGDAQAQHMWKKSSALTA